MPLFIEYFDEYVKRNCLQKQKDLLLKVKKDYGNSNDNLIKAGVEQENIGEVVDVKIGNSLETYFKGDKYPITNYPDQTSVDAITCYKKLFSLFIRNGKFKPITFIILILNWKVFVSWAEKVFGTYPILLKDEYWCPVVKELRRVLKIDTTAIDVISAILEYDLAYRYRFQDIFAELSKKDFIKNPSKEIIRLLDILIAREGGDKNNYIVQMWQKLKLYIPIGLFLFPKLKKELKKIISEIDCKNVEFSKADIYWTNYAKVYDYRGLPYKIRRKQYEYSLLHF